MSLGAAIKQLRDQKRLSQLQLANKAKINQGFLSQVEKDQRDPSLAIIKRVASALGVPVQVLLILTYRTEKSKKYAKQLKHIALLVDRILKEIRS